jgi:hypothetical protein
MGSVGRESPTSSRTSASKHEGGTHCGSYPSRRACPTPKCHRRRPWRLRTLRHRHPPPTRQVSLVRAPHRRAGPRGGGGHAPGGRARGAAGAGGAKGERGGRKGTHAWEVWGASPPDLEPQRRQQALSGVRTAEHARHGARVPRRNVAVEGRGARERCAAATPAPRSTCHESESHAKRACPWGGGGHQRGVHAVLLAPAGQRGRGGGAGGHACMGSVGREPPTSSRRGKHGGDTHFGSCL